MKTKTKIGKQLEKKRNDELISTIVAAKKKKAWLKVASSLATPRRIRPEFNLDEIDNLAKDGETIVIPGKVLSQGEITKKIKIVAFKFSKKAKEKLLKSKIQISGIVDEIEKNPDAKDIKVLTR